MTKSNTYLALKGAGKYSTNLSHNMLEAKLKIHVKVDFKFERRSISNEKYILQNPGKFKRNPQNYCYLIIIIWIMLFLTSVTPTDYHMAKCNAISMVWGAFRAKIIVKDTGVSTGGSRKGKKCFQHLSQGRKSKKCFQHLSPLPLSFPDMWEKVKREDLKTRIKDRGRSYILWKWVSFIFGDLQSIPESMV